MTTLHKHTDAPKPATMTMKATAPKPTPKTDSAAFDAATRINYAVGEIRSAAAEHVIDHKTVTTLLDKITAETTGLLAAVEATKADA